MENTNLWKQLESSYEQEYEIVFLSFKTKPPTQVFITDVQVKIWKSFYAFISFVYVFILVCTNLWIACL